MKPIRKNLMMMKTVNAVRLAMLENMAMALLLHECHRALDEAEPLCDEAKCILWYFEHNGVDTCGRDDNGDVCFQRAALKDVDNIASTILAADKIIPPGGARH